MHIKHNILANLRNVKHEIILQAINSTEKSAEYESKELIELASQFEEACYNLAILESESSEGLQNDLCEEIYHLKIARMVGFLEEEDMFKKIVEKISKHELKIDEIPNINVEKIYPERYIRQLERISESGKEMVLKYSTIYRCGRCGKNQTSTKSAQTSSCDEGATIFATCLICYNEFRV